MCPEPSMADGRDRDAVDADDQQRDRTGLDGEVIPGNDVTVVVVRGELDLATAGRCASLLDDAFARGLPVVLDLRQLEFIDSSGLSVLVRAHERVAGASTFSVRGPSRAIRRVLSISGVDQILDVEDGPADRP